MSKGETPAKVNYSTYPFIHALHPGTYISLYNSDLENGPGAIIALQQLAKHTVLLVIDHAPSLKTDS